MTFKKIDEENAKDELLKKGKKVDDAIANIMLKSKENKEVKITEIPQEGNIYYKEDSGKYIFMCVTDDYCYIATEKEEEKEPIESTIKDILTDMQQELKNLQTRIDEVEKSKDEVYEALRSYIADCINANNEIITEKLDVKLPKVKP